MESRFSISKRRLTWALLWLLLLAFTVPAQSTAPASTTALSATERELAESIKVETIRELVSSLVADAMQGRGTAQPGGEKAAAYLADRFAKLGLKPLGTKNSYLQPIKFRDREWLPESILKVGDQTFKLGSDFFVVPPTDSDKVVSGNLVFVAYGLQSTSPKRDDLAGIEVRGKVVVLLEGPPLNVSKPSWRQVKAQMTIFQNLVARGAAGLIIIQHGREEHPYAKLADYLTRRQIEPADVPETPDFVPPFLKISDAAADKLFAAAGVSRAEALKKAELEGFKPIDLKQSAKITLRVKKGKGIGNNVLGLLEGSDPKLNAEALVYSAHYDAFGLSSDNRIYPGAADNALGVAEMLAVAEALLQSTYKPRRSIIFMALTGEEYGGYGSDYWVHNPTWKIKQVAADINFDGMGTEVYGPVKVLVGYGAEHSSLGTVFNEVALASGLKVIPDPMPAEKAFYRSDHYYFVKKGVPGIMILGAPEGDPKLWIDRMKKWEETDYHQPTDTVRPEWNWEGPRQMAAIGLVIGLRVANDENMPEWLATSQFNRKRGTDEPPPPEP